MSVRRLAKPSSFARWSSARPISEELRSIRADSWRSRLLKCDLDPEYVARLGHGSGRSCVTRLSGAKPLERLDANGLEKAGRHQAVCIFEWKHVCVDLALQ